MTTIIYDLSGSLLREVPGADLRGAELRYAMLRYADLRGACMPTACLADSTLTDAYLVGADLTGADMARANLTRADIRCAVLCGADLEGADLTESDLTGADLTGADLTGADMAGARIRGACLRHANLTGSYVRGVDLTREQIESANTSAIKADIYRILSSCAPRELERLLAALHAGRFDGSASDGAGACIMATTRRCGVIRIPRDNHSESGVWFTSICKGDTPETSAVAAVTATWIETWLEVNS